MEFINKEQTTKRSTRTGAVVYEIDIFGTKSDTYNIGYDKIITSNISKVEKDKLISEYNKNYEK